MWKGKEDSGRESLVLPRFKPRPQMKANKDQTMARCTLPASAFL